MFPVHLQKGSLRLRPVRLPDDVSHAAAWYQDPEVLYYSEGGSAAVPFDEERVERMYRYLRMYQSLSFVKTSIHPDGCGNECIALQLSLNEEE